jgi:hypothetical protein
MRKRFLLLFAIPFLLILSCKYIGYYPHPDDPLPIPPVVTHHISYSISGAGTLTTANIIIFDDAGIEHDYSNVSLPATYDFPVYTAKKYYVWAQNNSSNFSDLLSLKITDDDGSWTLTKKGLYCVLEWGPMNLN